MSPTETKKAIQEAIEGFANEDLTTAGLHLFRTLGYRTDVRMPLPQRSYTDFAEIFVGGKKLDTAKAFTDHWASVDMLFQLSADHLTKQDNLFKNEQVDRTIIESYVFFAIELKAKGRDKQWTRTDLSQITREVNKLFAMPVMILFKYADTLTLSIIDRRLHKKEASKDVLEKVTLIKDIRTAGTHRAHIEILFDLSIEELRKKHGFTSFPKLHEAWRITHLTPRSSTSASSRNWRIGISMRWRWRSSRKMWKRTARSAMPSTSFASSPGSCSCGSCGRRTSYRTRSSTPKR